MTAHQKKMMAKQRTSVNVVITGTQPIDQSKQSHVGFSSNQAFSA